MQYFSELAFGIGGAAMLLTGSSIYEYYKCKGILRKKPDCSHMELVDLHNSAEYILTLLGAPGIQLAQMRYGKREK